MKQDNVYIILGTRFPVVTSFIIPTVFSVDGLWLLTSGLKGRSGEQHKEGRRFVVTRAGHPARFTQQ